MPAPAETQSPFPYADLLSDIQREWNAAEAAIKLSEQIALDLSIPAISELRYAGRRLIDALDIAHAGGTKERVGAVLEDARFCCHRARHNSIDAGLSKIAIDLDDLTKRLGYAPVAEAYPDFQILYVSFVAAREKVAQSRGDRQNRNAIYETVATVDFPGIATHYTNLLACKPIAMAYARKRTRERVGWWILLFIAISSMILAALAVDWDKVGDKLSGRPDSSSQGTVSGLKIQ